jgi:hypothetical protein
MNNERSYESNLINNALFRPFARFNNIIYNLLFSNVKELENNEKIIHDLILKIADNENDFHIQLENKNKDINDLKKDLENKNNIINEQRLLLLNKNKDINNLRNKNDEINKCSICLNNTISHCCTPCGHTYCYNCINESNNCYICRSNIHNNIKIYL